MVACLRLPELPPTPAGTLDWPTLTDRLIGDGLATHVYRRYREQPDLLPAGVLNSVKRNYYQNASANHIRLQELRQIGQALHEAGIRLLVLKGGALATTVFPDPALRFMGDLDVAVPPAHSAAALRLLQARGYLLHDDIASLDDPALLREQGWHLRLTRTVWGKQVELEFHWPMREQVLVSQVATLDVRRMWQTAAALDESANLWQPAPPLMLLHLCLHTGLQHRFNDLGLRHYLDIDRVVRHYQARPGFWPTVVQEAQATRASHVTYFCLMLANELLGTPIPAGVLDTLRPPAWKIRQLNRLLRPDDIINRRRALYDRRRWWWRLLTTDRLADLLLGPWQVLFPGRDFLASYYHTQAGWRLAAYACWHPFHALARAARRRLQNAQSLLKRRGHLQRG